MIEIGGMPILWHIMKSYSAQGINDFIICLGYKGYVIKEYFANYFLHMSDVTIDTTANSIEVHHKRAETWKITLVDTGEDSQTGERLRRVAQYLDNEEDFCFTYGDGLSNVDIRKSIEFHRSHDKMITMTAVVPPSRYGAVKLNGSSVERFIEKPTGGDGLINGGYFILSRSVFAQIPKSNSSFENEILPSLANRGEVEAFVHLDFWHAMDTLRDKQHLEVLWATNPPWKSWE
jgi:glucose-1-phosphate cytidylyltransferase